MPEGFFWIELFGVAPSKVQSQKVGTPEERSVKLIEQPVGIVVWFAEKLAVTGAWYKSEPHKPLPYEQALIASCETESLS